MSRDWLDHEIALLRAEQDRAADARIDAQWHRLRPAVARRARRRRAAGATLLALFGCACFGAGRITAEARAADPSHQQATLTPALAVQQAGASFVTRLAGLRGELAGSADDAELREARVVAISVVTGAAAELARTGTEPELTEILRLTTDARRRLAHELETPHAP